MKGTLERIFSEFKKDTILLAIGVIILGLILIFFPLMATDIICYAIGGLLIVGGICKIVEYFREPPAYAFGSFGLMLGTLLSVVGLVFIINPGVLAKIVTTIIAVILIADGVLKIQHAVNLSRIKAARWWIVLTVGIVISVIGIIAMFNPFGTVALFMRIIGIVLVINGVFDLFTLFYVTKSVRTFTDALSEHEALNVEAVPVDEEK